MQQTTPSSTPIPTEFSPEFSTWLANEKNEASRHRFRVLKMAFAAILFGTALVLLKEQPNWVQQIVEVATQVKS
jgi:hypothetical protein